jgi:hypothetical protein
MSGHTSMSEFTYAQTSTLVLVITAVVGDVGVASGVSVVVAHNVVGIVGMI